MSRSVKCVVLTLWCLFCVSVLPLSAQQQAKFSIASFALDNFDMSAQSKEYEKFDGNGDRFAIVKVMSNLPNDDLNAYLFNFGMMKSVVDDGNHDGELWIYVQKNAKHVTITRKGFVPIKKYDLQATLLPGRTYVMKLTTAGPALFKQMVKFEMEPKDAKAVVMVTSEGGQEELFGIQQEATGAVAKSLPYGTYTYKISSELYKSTEGRFKLDNNQTIYQEKVTLQPNFSLVTLQVPGDAMIYVNGEPTQKSHWSGKLKVGDYFIECKQDRHRNSSQHISVAENQEQTFELVPPAPIIGSLSLNSNPLGARVTIDGEQRGVTPVILNDLLIGDHELVLAYDDYKEAKQHFEIKENQIEEVAVDLQKIEKKKNSVGTLSLTSMPTGAAIHLDGEYCGVTPRQISNLCVGKHKLVLEKNFYKTNKQKITIREDRTTSLNVVMEEVQKKGTAPRKIKSSSSPDFSDNSFYFDLVAGVGTAMDAGVDVGAYFSNFNVEAFFNYGLLKEDFRLIDKPTGAESDQSVNYLKAGVRFGYGFNLGSRFRMTPQVGVANFGINSKDISSHAISALLGVKCEYLLSSHVALTLAPEGMFAVKKGDVYDRLSEVTSKLKGWTTGGVVRVGVEFCF